MKPNERTSFVLAVGLLVLAAGLLYIIGAVYLQRGAAPSELLLLETTIIGGILGALNLKPHAPEVNTGDVESVTVTNGDGG